MKDYYAISSQTELADYLSIGQPAIAKWIKNNSVKRVKEKCIELGIYEEIYKGKVS